MNSKLILLIVIAFISLSNTLKAQKPLFSHIYTADASAHVWPNDTSTLWLYTSHDEAGTNHHATMHDYHVFSTKDLVNWIDYGRVMAVEDVEWAVSHAWAIDAAFWKGKYYLVFCMRPKINSTDFKIGMALSDRPEGPFKNVGIVGGIEKGMDPSLFVENDKAYLLYAQSRHCYIAQLNDDFLSIKKNTLTDISEGLPQLQEGPWLHKFNNKYYLSYPGLQNDQWPEVMYYSISDSPFGPYKSGGQYIPYFEGQGGSNHGSIVKFKGKWIAFHHGNSLSGGNSYERNVLADFLYYNADGSIGTIIPNNASVSDPQKTSCVIKLEAENGLQAGGKNEIAKFDNKNQGFSGRGYVTNFKEREAYSQVLVQLAKDQNFDLYCGYESAQNTSIAILIDAFMVNGGYDNWKDIILKKTNGFEESFIATIKLKAGNNKISLMSVQGDLNIDYFLLKPIDK